VTAVLWLLVLLPIASWATAIILARAALERPRVPLLTAVAAASLLGALGGTFLAPLALARLLDWSIEPPVPTLLLVGGVLIFSLPGPAFLFAYLVGWFERQP